MRMRVIEDVFQHLSKYWRSFRSHHEGVASEVGWSRIQVRVDFHFDL